MRRNLYVILPSLSLHGSHLSTFLPDLQDIQGILLLYLHHGSSQLYPFIEILKYLLLYRPNLLLLIDPAAISANAIISLNGVFPMTAIDPGQAVLVLPKISDFLILLSSIITESNFQLFYFSMKVIDDILVLTDVQRN